jgi:L-threonylcarbamoyladenylate synthase
VSVSRSQPLPEIAAAADRLARDGLVAYPTETVWGLGALARSEQALEALRRFKGRDAGQPISILVSAARDLLELGFAPSADAMALMEGFWPGPLTLVMPSPRDGFARGVARPADRAVGVRCSPHPIALSLAAECARRGIGPLTATSLNYSGQAPATSRAQALAICAGAEAGPAVLPAGPPADPAARPSTVIDLCVAPPRILREGALGREIIEEKIGLAPEKEERR